MNNPKVVKAVEKALDELMAFITVEAALQEILDGGETALKPSAQKAMEALKEFNQAERQLFDQLTRTEQPAS